MLRNSFLNGYKVKIHKGIEFEGNSKKQDDYYNLYKNRPIGEKEIQTIPSKQLNSFVEELMTNRKATSILFSSNANKEINRYLHSNQVFEKNTLTQKSSAPSTTSNGERRFDMVKKKEYSLNYNKIKQLINQFKTKRMFKFNTLNKKNMVFYDEIKQQAHSRGHSNETVNSLRMTNYNRSFQRCRSFLENKPNFKLPNVSLNVDNVFSRLFHNVVQWNQYETESNRGKKRMLSGQSFTGRKNRRAFNIKNVIKSSNGKEFTMKITEDAFNRCFFNHSGGPLANYEASSLMKSKDSNKCISNSEDFESLSERPLLSLSTMKDNNGNSYLHDAVLDGAYEFVKFYLGKRLSPNEKNFSGNTPMHYAMKLDDIKIIKLLLENKGDFTIKNSNGETAYDLASTKARKIL